MCSSCGAGAEIEFDCFGNPQYSFFLHPFCLLRIQIVNRFQNEFRFQNILNIFNFQVVGADARSGEVELHRKRHPPPTPLRPQPRSGAISKTQFQNCFFEVEIQKVYCVKTFFLHFQKLDDECSLERDLSQATTRTPAGKLKF